jgi:hypothetical protein
MNPVVQQIEKCWKVIKNTSTIFSVYIFYESDKFYIRFRILDHRQEERKISFSTQGYNVPQEPVPNELKVINLYLNLVILFVFVFLDARITAAALFFSSWLN